MATMATWRMNGTPGTNRMSHLFFEETAFRDLFSPGQANAYYDVR